MTTAQANGTWGRSDDSSGRSSIEHYRFTITDADTTFTLPHWRWQVGISSWIRSSDLIYSYDTQVLPETPARREKNAGGTAGRR